MTSARQAMLAKIRTSLETAVLPADRRARRVPAPHAALDPAAMMEIFAREIRAVAGMAHLAATQAQALVLVLELLQRSGGKRLLAWAEDELPLPGLGGALRRAGFTFLNAELAAEPVARREQLRDLASASAGLTGAYAGLAQTGSLVLFSGAGRPRLASLLPPMHIALLPIESLYPTLVEFFQACPQAGWLGSNLVFITGPSRSADIELTLALGVHGPRELHVILLSSL